MSNVFGGSHGATVQNSTFHVTTTYQATVSKGFNILTQAVARNAFHNSDHRHDPPKCHENTRVAIIQKIMDWVTGKIDTDALMFWLFGPAGVGKSAIARTIAELCEAQKLLLASFFFFRTDSGRNTINPLIASIAYRIACVVPVARGPIETVIEEDPLILSYSLETQLKKLVLEPLHLLSEQGHFLQTPLPPLIIIDGVDECLDQDAQTKLIRLLSNSVAQYQLPLKFFIASRPEQHIKFAFTAVPKQLLSFLQLYNDFECARDIRLFLEDKFGHIKKHHPFRADIPASWPSEEHMDILVLKASGQFIYVSLAAEFINSPHHPPTRRLDTILNLRPPGNHDLPFAELDALYTSILARSRDPHLAIKVIGLGVALQEQSGTSFVEADVSSAIETVLNLEDGDVHIILSDLTALLALYLEPSGMPSYITQIHIHHSSFIDFLSSKERSRDYYIDIHESHSLIAKYILQTSTETNLDFFKSVTLGSLDLLIHLRNSVSTPEMEYHLKKFSLGRYLDQYAPGAEQIGHYAVLDTMAEDFFNYLKETERNELYCHHSALYLEHVMASIERRPSPEKFHIISTIWFVLQKPLKLCESKRGEVVEPFSNHLAPLWRKFCAALCGFEDQDVDWDTYLYFLMRYPTTYNSMRASLEPLASIYGAITETTTLVDEPILSHRLACVATSCIQSLRRRGSRKTSLHAWATKSKRSPWIWRWRTRATSTRRGQKVQSELQFLMVLSPKRKPYSFPNSLRRPRQMLFSKGFQSEEFNWDARLSYMWALDLLRRTLRKARKSDELMEELSKPFIHWPAPILFPRRTSRVKKAIDAYLEKFGPPPSSLDIQFDFRDTLAAESSFNEVEYASCESSDEDGYYSCPES